MGIKSQKASRCGTSLVDEHEMLLGRYLRACVVSVNRSEVLNRVKVDIVAGQETASIEEREGSAF